MNTIELGRRAEAAKENYLTDLFDRLYEQVKADFMLCSDPAELQRLWDRKEAINYIYEQISIDIQRGLIAKRDLNDN